MKRHLKICLLLAAIAAVLCVSAYAADSTEPTSSGIYGVTIADGLSDSVTVTPQNAAGNDVTADGTYNGTAFYPDAVRLELTVTGGSGYYLVIAQSDNEVPTASNIVYIDQTAVKGDSTTFNIYPSTLASGKTYYVYLASSGGTGRTLVASFSYYVAYTLGDVDADEKVSVVDAMFVLQYITGSRTFTEKQMLAADVDADNKISVIDAMFILQAITGSRKLG
jgi:hypothetical protein